MNLSVIIVSYNVREFVGQCLRSLERAHFQGALEFILVDNDSYDGTVEMVKERFPDVRIIRNPRNTGFARAVNQGVASAHGDVFLLLNPDTIVEEQTLQVLVDYLGDHPEVGCVGPKILNSDGSLQAACKRSFPRPWVALTRLLGLARLFPRSRLFGKYNLTFLDPDQTHEVDAVSGSCMCIPRPVYEQVGPLDESFFLFGEDLDYCYRIHEAGYQVVYYPATQIVHYKGESVKVAPFDNLHYFYDAMVKFSKKYDSFSGGIITRGLVRTGIRLRAWLAYLQSYLATFSSLLIDAAVVLLAFFAMILIRFLPPPELDIRGVLLAYLPVVMVYLALWLSIGGIFQIYGRYVLSYSRALVASLIGFLVIATLTYLYKQVAYSRLVLVSASALVAVMLPGWRLYIHMRQSTHRLKDSQRAQRPSIFSRRAVILGAGQEGQRIAGLLARRPDTGINLLGVIDDHPPTQTQEGGPAFNYLGRTHELRELMDKYRFQEIIVAGESFTNQRIMSILEENRDLRLMFRIVPHEDDFMLGKANVEHIGDIPFVNVELTLFRRFHLLSKRLFDLLTAGVLIVVLLPVWPILIVIHGVESVEIWTFDGGRRKIHRLKRGKESIRHLPLLWSIFSGGISFVGADLVPTSEPDPHLLFKPGMTGLVRLRESVGPFAGESEVTQRYDHYYLQHQSLTFDVEIILKTLFRI